MIIQQIITSDIPVLRPEDNGVAALDLLQEFSLSNLPVVDENGHYIALIKEVDLQEWTQPDDSLATAPFLYFRPIVYAHTHPYEAARILAQQDIDLLPVIEEEGNRYLGSVTRSGLFDFLIGNSGIDKPGGIVVLEMKPVDYSLSEVARICENSDVIVTNVQIFSDIETGKIRVVLKTNTRDLQALLASFDRYEYNVKEVFAELSAHESMLERYQSLMHYINM